MATKLIRDAVLVCVIVGAGVLALFKREYIYDFVGVHPADIVEARALRENPTASPKIDKTSAMVIKGSATSISKSPDGHFWAEARVNASSVKFLVDTGASVVALTPRDAQLAGLDLNALKYTAAVNTAAGRVMAAPVTLDVVSVGNVMVRDVRAVVINEGLPNSLLGMSYLGKLQTVEASPGMMILRQ